MIQFAWLIPLLPLVGFVIIGVLNKRLSISFSGTIAASAVFLSFLLSVTVFSHFLRDDVVPEKIVLFDWIETSNISISFSFLLDQLSAIMLLVVTGVGFLIHVYSIGYMHHDQDHPRFFAYLNLFVFFMLLLVLGSNLLVMFIGWEGVGLCSYLLIGFWFKNNDYNNAAKKAFVMNRIGDLGLLLGIFLIFVSFGSLEFMEIIDRAKRFSLDESTITIICLLLFIGAMGKSAQIPLYTWLPDAMAGPTPVSALIHAATMVTAGIYMVVRTNVLFALSPDASAFIAAIGLATALFAATIGLKQNDIKKVLAYSTVSQLGYMFVALGVGAYDTALFHVVTHAFFKALLFLGAGSVIHAMSGEQDIRNMGGLKKILPITHFTFLIGTLAIAGLPPFAGFFSKDEILAAVYGHNKVFFFVLAFTSVLTAVYMFRLYWLTFYGEFRGNGHQRSHLHESPSTITLPLIVLAVLSTLGGFLGMPEIFHQPHFLKEFLHPIIWKASSHSVSHNFEYALIGTSIVVLLLIIVVTYRKYVTQNAVPISDEKLSGFSKVIANKYYVDEIYNAIITKPLDGLSNFSNRYVEKGAIDGLVNSIGKMFINLSASIKNIQTGNVGNYVISMVVAIIVIVLVNLIL